jgi:hypothetical protein
VAGWDTCSISDSHLAPLASWRDPGAAASQIQDCVCVFLSGSLLEYRRFVLEIDAQDVTRSCNIKRYRTYMQCAN